MQLHSISLNFIFLIGYGYTSKDGYYRTSINLMLFAWKDIEKSLDLIELNDELAFTVYIPQRTGIHNIICGKALYSHAAFDSQRNSLQQNFDETFILTEYTKLRDNYLI